MSSSLVIVISMNDAFWHKVIHQITSQPCCFSNIFFLPKCTSHCAIFVRPFFKPCHPFSKKELGWGELNLTGVGHEKTFNIFQFLDVKAAEEISFKNYSLIMGLMHEFPFTSKWLFQCLPALIFFQDISPTKEVVEINLSFWLAAPVSKIPICVSFKARLRVYSLTPYLL